MKITTKNLLLLIVFFLPYLSFSQKELIKKIVLSDKFTYEQNAKTTWTLSRKKTGNDIEIDTLTIYLDKQKKIKLDNKVLMIHKSWASYYDGKSIIYISNNGKSTTTDVNKYTFKNIEHTNTPNPYYKKLYLFSDLLNSQKFEENDSTYIFKYQKSTKEADYYTTYTFSKADTNLTTLKKVLNPKVNYLTQITEEYTYIELKKDIPNLVLENVLPVYNPNITNTKAPKPHTEQSFKNLQLISLDNDSMLFNSLEAEYYLLDFWYIGCVPCMQALPYIEELNEKYPNILTIGINPTNTNFKEISDFLKKNHVKYKTYSVNYKNLPKDLIKAYPTFVLLDKDFNVLYVQSGFSKKQIKQLEKVIIEKTQNK